MVPAQPRPSRPLSFCHSRREPAVRRGRRNRRRSLSPSGQPAAPAGCSTFATVPSSRRVRPGKRRILLLHHRPNLRRLIRIIRRIRPQQLQRMRQPRCRQRALRVSLRQELILPSRRPQALRVLQLPALLRQQLRHRIHRPGRMQIRRIRRDRSRGSYPSPA